MRKLLSILLIALVALTAPVAMADTASDVQAAFIKGNLVHLSYQGSFACQTNGILLAVCLTNRPLYMAGWVTSVGGMRVYFEGPVILSNRGTALPKAWNPYTTKTNFLQVKSFTTPTGTLRGAVAISNSMRTQASPKTNAMFLVPAGTHVAMPFPQVFFKGTLPTQWLFHLQNVHTTNQNYSIELDIWQ